MKKVLNEEEIVLWNGLRAKLRGLENAPDIIQICKKVRRGGGRVLASKHGIYWLVEVPVDGTTVYLVVSDARFLGRELMKRVILPDRKELYSRILLVVYDGVAHFWADPSGQTILFALDQKINPGIVAITKSQPI